VAGNPRIDDLRRRLDKDPGSRLFAQLAEELRKDGDLEEAIRVSREGLHKHPAYPSARMTLGRALLDTGDLTAARTEFEIVLKGAPDNILASRFLGECLEGLGDLEAARDRFKATLALSPGDKVVTAHLQDVEAKLKKTASAGAAPAGAAPAATGIPRREEPGGAPIPLSRVDEPMELERSAEARTVTSRAEPGRSPESTVVISAMPVPPPSPQAPPAPKEQGAEAPPIPLVVAEEDFELERPYEVPSAGAPSVPAADNAAAHATAGGFESSGPAAEFEFDAAPEGAATRPVPEPWEPTPAATVRLPEPAPEPEAEPPIPPPPPAIAAPVPPPPIPIPPPKPREREAIQQNEARPIHSGAPEVPDRVVPAAPPLPPPVFAPAPPPPPPPRMDAAPAPEADELTSSTLAELYFNQGFTDKAVEVYRQLLQREPGNERGRTRLAELEALERRLEEEEARAAPPAGGGPADGAAARRQAIERTIARLEGLLAALRKE
jgi:tetratricopeptide (TPR) repeat protein